MIRRLCQPGTTWTLKQGTDEKVSFPHTSLSRYGKAWYSFICANLMPTRHQNAVTKDRAILLYGIVRNKKIDVGGIINTSITKYLRGSTSGGIPHASLITRLCLEAGVQWEDTEPLQVPMTAIDHATIQRYRVWDGGISHPSGAGFIVQQPQPEEQQDQEPEQPVGPLPIPFEQSIQALHNRLDRQDRRLNRRLDAIASRMDAMMNFNAQFSSTLSQFLNASSSSQAQFPVYGDIPPYPPPDSPDDEVADDSDQGSPQF